MVAFSVLCCRFSHFYIFEPFVTIHPIISPGDWRDGSMRSAHSIFQLLIFFACAAPVWSQDVLDRTVLPIPEPQPPVITELDARNVKAPPRFDVRAPKGAPNVEIVRLDVMGFGQSSAFGGPIHILTLDMLAAQRLRSNNFHTRALCSPTRNALWPTALDELFDIPSRLAFAQRSCLA
jgi:hypothetical protein